MPSAAPAKISRASLQALANAAWSDALPDDLSSACAAVGELRSLLAAARDSIPTRAERSLATAAYSTAMPANLDAARAAVGTLRTRLAAVSVEVAARAATGAALAQAASNAADAAVAAAAAAMGLAGEAETAAGDLSSSLHALEDSSNGAVEVASAARIAAASFAGAAASAARIADLRSGGRDEGVASDGVRFDLFDRASRRRPPPDAEDWQVVLDAVKQHGSLALDHDEMCGRTPLHWAVNRDAPVDVVKALLDVAPSIARVGDRWGWTPLHLAARRCRDGNAMSAAAGEIVQLLVDAAPDTAARQDASDRSTPLHLATQCGAAHAVVYALALAAPEAASMCDRYGRTALHLAALRGAAARSDVVSTLLMCDEESAVVGDRDGRTPLHLAARCGVSSAVLAALIEASPDSMTVQDAEGATPLQSSLAQRAVALAEEIPIALLEACPEAAEMVNRHGARPLRTALEMGAPAAVLHALLAASVAPAADCDRADRSTPLHLAVANGVSASVLDALVKADRASKKAVAGKPGAARQEEGTPSTAMKDRDGNIPLHVAIAAGASAATVAFLVAADAESASIVNAMGATPLHMALHSRSALNVVRCLLDASPATLEVKDSRGRLPLHNALHNIEHVNALLALAPTAVREPDGAGDMPLHLAAQYSSSVDVVQALLAVDRTVANELSRGCSPLQLAAQSNAAKDVVDVLLACTDPSIARAAWAGRLSSREGTADWAGYLPDEGGKKEERMNENAERALIIEVKTVGVDDVVDAANEAAVVVDTAKERAAAALRDRYEGVTLADSLFTEMSPAAASRTALYLCTKTLPPATTAEWEQVQMFVDSFPTVGEMVDDNFQRSPLMWAVEKGAPSSVVLNLLDAAPAVAHAKDKWGWAALHLALRRRASSDVIMALLDENAEMASVLPANGSLPLHIAAAQLAEVSTIRRLLKEHPDATAVLDRAGRTPLHLAVGTSSLPLAGVVSALLLAHPAAANIRDRRGDAPVHIAARQRGIAADIMIGLISVAPEITGTMDSKKATPLHHAAGLASPLSVVQCLLVNAPAATRMQDRSGNRPLMVALSTGAAAPVILALLRAALRTAADKDRSDGSTCMHRAIENNASVEVIRALVENDGVVQVVNASPPIVRIGNKDGVTPLLRAIEVRAAPGVVQALLKSDPSVVAAAGDKNRTMLHAAAQHGSSAAFLSVLVDAVPEAARMVDESGRSALHLCTGNADALRVLLDAAPTMLLTRDQAGMVPLHYAAQRGGPLDAVQLLLLEAPEGASILDNQNRAPLHCAMEFWNRPRLLDALSRFSGKIATEIATSYGFHLWNTVQVVRKRDEAKKLAEMESDAADAVDESRRIVKRTATNAQPWMRGVTKEGVSYYINTVEKTSFWQLPVGVDPVGVRDEIFSSLTAPRAAPAGLPRSDRKLTKPIVADALLKLSQYTDQGAVSLSLWAEVMNAARAFPGCMTQTDKHFKRAPLLWALERSAPTEVLLDMIAVAPKAVRKVDKFGYAALHLALRRQCAPEVVLALITAEPSFAIKSLPGDRSLPLHIAAAKQASIDVIQSLLKAAPDATSALDRLNRTPLHHAVDMSNPQVDVVTSLLLAHPTATSMKDSRGDAPLQIAARQRGVSPDIITMLISVDPSIGCAIGSKKATPLHHAARLGAPLSVIQSLLMNAPTATQVKDRSGNRPLMVALGNAASTAVVLALLRAAPNRAGDTDRVDGSTCMHRAIENNASIEVVRALVENDVIMQVVNSSFPIVRVVNKDQATPLRRAIEVGVSPAIVKALLKSDRTAVTQTGSMGRTVLHDAALAGTSAEILSVLIDAAPEVAAILDESGRSALHICTGSVEALRVLYDAAPSMLTARDEAGMAPLHHVAQRGRSVASLQFLISIDRAMVSTPNEDGHVPLMLALRARASFTVLDCLAQAGPAAAVRIARTLGMDQWHSAAALELHSTKSMAPIDSGAEELRAVFKEVVAERERFFHLTGRGRSKPATTEELRVVFDAFDTDGGGDVDGDELAQMLQKLGVVSTPDSVAAMLAKYDADGNGALDFEEFILLTKELVLTAYADTAMGGDDDEDADSADNGLPLEAYRPAQIWEPGTILNTALVGSTLLKLAQSPPSKHCLHEWSAVLGATRDYPDALMQTDQYFGRTPLAWAVDKLVPSKVLTVLIERCPQAAGITDKWGQAPLHLALRRGVATDVALALIDAEPAMVSKLRSGDRFWPLHIAASQRASLMTIRRLIEVAPQAAVARDKLRRMPLHHAVDCSNPREEVITALLMANPAAAKVKDGRGDAPLHIAARQCTDQDIITMLLSIEPSVGSDIDSKRSTVLHHAVRLGAPLSVVHALILNAPAALGVEDHAGNRPLMVALQNKASTPVVLALLDAAAMSAADVDEHGNTCMHEAIVSKASIEVIRALVENDVVVRVMNNSPKVIRVKNRDGKTPLRRAIEVGASPQIVSALLRSDPTVITATDVNGLTALHHAAVYASSADLLHVLIEAAPSAAGIVDANQRSPLHLCAGDADAVRTLLEAAPAMAVAQDKFGMVPLHHAVRRGGPMDGLIALAEDAPAAGAIADFVGQTPLHFAVNSLVDEEIIQAIVSSCQKAAVDIATSLGVSDWWRVLALLDERRKNETALVSRAVVSPTKEIAILDEKKNSEDFERKEEDVENELVDQAAASVSNGDDEMQPYFGPASFYSTDPAILGQALIRICQQQNLAPDGPEWKQLLVMAELHPESLTEVDGRTGRCPLQLAAFNGAPMYVLRKLLELNPATACLQDKWNWTALHLALRRQRPVQFIQALINACPDACSIVDVNDKSTALHLCAADGQYPSSLLTSLITIAPDTVTAKDSKARLPLHRLAESGKATPNEFTTLLFASPAAASKPTSTGDYPLHLALRSGTPPDIIMLLASTFPGAVALSDTSGVYPLHRVCSSKYLYPVGDCEIVEVLHKAAPLVARELDRHRERPLIHALTRGFPISIIKMLLQASADAITDIDVDTRSTVLHCAVRGNVGSGVIRMILEADVIGRVIKARAPLISCEDADGKTALHVALELPAPPSVVCEIIRSDKSGECPVDTKGKSMLQHALTAPSLLDVEEVVEAMLAMYPKSCELVDQEGHNALHIAVAHDASLEVVQLLMSASPECASNVDSNGSIPLQTAMESGMPRDVIAYLSESSHHSAVGLLLTSYTASPPQSPERASTSPTETSVACVESEMETAQKDEVEEYAENSEKVSGGEQVSPSLVEYSEVAAAHAVPELQRFEDPEYIASLEAALADLDEEGARRYVSMLCVRPQREQTAEMWRQVKRLVTMRPTLAHDVETRFGRSPLHWAANGHAPLDVIETVIQANPSCIVRLDKSGKSPIALALQRAAPVSVVAAMLDANDEAISAVGPKGGTLLHAAFLGGSNPAIVSLLVSRMTPEAVASCDSAGRTALHIAAEKNAGYAAFNCVLSAAPDSTCVQDKRLGVTPLHLAPMAIRGSYCSDEVLLLLMKASKEAAGLVNRNGQLPLHALLASGRTVTTQMVMMLLFFHRDSAAHCDAFGRTPVILAMSSPSVPIDVKLAIIGAASAKGPAAVGIAEQQYGRTALHYCTASDASIEVIRVLVTSAPAAAKVFDKSGKCPLVLALENERATEEVVACLLSAAPSAVVAPLPAGKNALHVAVKRQYSVDTLKSLIEADVVARLSTPSGSARSGLLMLDDSGRSPLHIAIEGKYSPNIIGLLVAGNSEAAAFRNRDRKSALHILMEQPPHAATSAVCSLLIESNADLATQGDRSGYRPAHCACVSGQSMVVLQQVCSSSKDNMSTWKTNAGDTPLHTILKQTPASLDCVELLVNSCLKWASVANNGGLLPLLLALRNHEPAIVSAVSRGLSAEAAKASFETFLSSICSDGVPPGRWHAITALLAAHPGVALAMDVNGRTPLHLAVGQQAPQGITLAILATDPSAASVKDAFNKTPLHRAAEVDAPRAVVGAIALSSPESATELTIENALRRASLRAPSEAEWTSIAELIARFPNLLQSVNSGGDPLLHRLLQLPVPCPMVKKMLIACPDAAFLTNAAGQTPLHICIQQKQSVDFIGYLMSLIPTATTSADSSGLTPLHVAAMTESSSATLRLLLEANRDVAHCADKWGMMPLHLCLRGGGSAEDIGLLLDAAPGVADTPNLRGLQPLQIAMETTSVTLDAIGLIASCAPVSSVGIILAELVQVQATACFAELDVERLLCILKAQPVPAISIVDAQGNFLLHQLLCLEDVPIEVLDVVFAACPSHASMPNAAGQYPVEIAMHAGVPTRFILDLARSASRPAVQVVLSRVLDHSRSFDQEVWHDMAAIVRQHPDSMRGHGDIARTPLHLAVLRAAVVRDVPVEMIEAILSANPEAAAEEDAYGRTAYRIATEKRVDSDILKVMQRYSRNTVVDIALQRFLDQSAGSSTTTAEWIAMGKIAVAQLSVFALRSAKSKGTLLHVAIEYGAPEAVILDLIAAYPAAAGVRDSKGQFPLQIAAKMPSTTSALLHSLASSAPQVAATMSVERYLQNEAFSMTSESLGKLLRLVESQPKTAAAYNAAGQTLLHIAIQRKLPAADIERLAELCPAAARVCDSNGRTPLHVAAGLGDTTSVSKLVRVAREVVGWTDTTGHSPLHLAAMSRNHRGSSPCVAMLFAASPELAHLCNNAGQTPLHSAFEHSGSEASINMLVHAAPGVACIQENKTRYTPLHRMMYHRMWKGKYAADICGKLTAAALMRDSRGRSPLQLARVQGAPAAVIAKLSVYGVST